MLRRHGPKWIAHRPGGLEVFELVDGDVPVPGAGEVTVGVRASGVNPADAKHVAEGVRPHEVLRGRHPGGKLALVP
jgi:NADPH:quinone reductase-like Zn-dependent oxidoreductase